MARAVLVFERKETPTRRDDLIRRHAEAYRQLATLKPKTAKALTRWVLNLLRDVG